jgi:hypothetical protein
MFQAYITVAPALPAPTVLPAAPGPPCPASSRSAQRPLTSPINVVACHNYLEAIATHDCVVVRSEIQRLKSIKQTALSFGFRAVQVVEALASSALV